MALEPAFGATFGGADLFPSLEASALQGLQPLLDDFGLFCEVLQDDVLPSDLTVALTPTLLLAQKYCPVKTGRLRASGYVESASTGNGTVTCEIGFGKDDDPPYAIMVHENPAAYHEPPTQAKFLERAVYEDSMNVMDRLYRSVKASLEL